MKKDTTIPVSATSIPDGDLKLACSEPRPDEVIDCNSDNVIP
jgi:hypothetical protein